MANVTTASGAAAGFAAPASMLGGGSGVASDIKEKGAYFGRPAVPAGEGLRAFMMVPKLPDFLSRLRALEKRVKELEAKEL